MASFEVATQNGKRELSEQEAALVAAQQGQYEGIQLTIPLLKIGQPGTRDVQDGDVALGEFFNSLTGDPLGDSIEFIVAGFHRGRFLSRQGDPRTYVTAEDIVPANWEAGDPHIGQPFAEHPDAEEQWRIRSNAGDIKWGKGPPIQTTFNFTGYVVGSDVPVRLSLKSTQLKVGRRWVTLLQILKAPWDAVFNVSTTRKSNEEQQTWYLPEVKRGRATTAEERQAAVELALSLGKAEVIEGGDHDTGPEAKAASEAAEAAAAEAGSLSV